MDSAKSYHTWISECFPEEIRVADRFLGQWLVIDALQEVRKTIQRELLPRAKAWLKTNHLLLNPLEESLSVESKKTLEELLGYSPLLRKCWEWKEAFTTWYNDSPNTEVATHGFKSWFEQGDKIDHETVKSGLKSMRKWKNEIINYHRCRWTNATVEVVIIVSKLINIVIASHVIV
ncbi:hypothetical protein PMSD_25090 [Paenibacillus macquariensis subsp. defensor]|nr:hypothetical protein PMSD_25090 [Paenibacillus macquariensis subsp. defensor]